MPQWRNTGVRIKDIGIMQWTQVHAQNST